LAVAGQPQDVLEKVLGWTMIDTEVSTLIGKAGAAGDERLEGQVRFLSAVHSIAVAVAKIESWKPSDAHPAPGIEFMQFRAKVKVFFEYHTAAKEVISTLFVQDLTDVCHIGDLDEWCCSRALSEDLIAQCNSMFTKYSALWTSFLTTTSKHFAEWSPVWKPHMAKLLASPDIVKALVSNPHYAQLSALSKVAHTALQSLKSIHGDGSGLPKIVEVVVIKSALDMAKDRLPFK
jgi:hypothetical protein